MSFRRPYTPEEQSPWRKLPALLFLCVLLAGCGKPAPDRVVTWAELVHRLADVEQAARLDTWPSGIVTSVDPAGSNDDFNHFQKKGPPGWVILADLKGPGYVSRFWFTGASSGEHPLRFYVDGAKEPTWDGTVGQWCGSQEPFNRPLAVYENYCWHSYVPIPFSKRLVIMMEEGGTKPGGWPRLFYQVNHTTLPENLGVQPFTPEPPEDVVAALAEVGTAWNASWMDESKSNDALEVEVEVDLPPGRATSLLTGSGPAVLRRLSLALTMPPDVSATARTYALRELVLQVRYNGNTMESVDVPLGDFFGSFWRPLGFQSFFFGERDGTFHSRWTMPFEQGMEISVLNQGQVPAKIKASAEIQSLASWDPGLGYLHAAWTRTSPQDLGRPHDVLRTTGEGRLAACILSTCSFDKSWWLLEGDESIRVDGEETPSWLGTGLEDYFNSGWYYQNPVARPLHGLVFKAPFRTVQYRIHLPDAVRYEQSIDMVFERGPDNASQGDIESTALYYARAPGKAPSRLGGPAQRRPPRDPHMPYTLMTELVNHERLGDFHTPTLLIDSFLEQVKEFPFEPVLRLRQLAYRERSEGFEAVRPDYEAFQQTSTNGPALAAAAQLVAFHEDVNRALLVMNCNVPTRAYIDGVNVGEAGAHERVSTFLVDLTPGTHILLLESDKKAKPYPEWIQATLRTHHGDVFTDPDWQMAYGNVAGFVATGLDQATWQRPFGTGVKGPPEVPFVWQEPNAFVGAQSRAVGLRPPDPWPVGQRQVVYRKTFTTP